MKTLLAPYNINYAIQMIIGEMFDVDLMKQNVCFWIRMSDEGVGGEAYSHEGMRKKDSCIVVCAGFWWYLERWMMWTY